MNNFDIRRKFIVYNILKMILSVTVICIKTNNKMPGKQFTPRVGNHGG